MSTEDAFKSLSSASEGIGNAEANRRLKHYGANTIQESTNTAPFILFISQFKSPVTILLILAAILSAALGDVTNTHIILAIVLISSLLGFWQERGAADAVKALLKMVQLQTVVLRERQETVIPTQKVVPGDVVRLSAGDIIPGDALLINSNELFVDEAAFTGETFPVEKRCCMVSADTVISQRNNALFMGTHIISGKATALIIKTGKQTEFGKISEHLRLREPETEFERGTRKFGYMLMEITLLLVIIIFGVNVFLHKPVLDSFLFSLALAVGLTPQLLPAIMSVNLAAGAKSMAKKKVIVKRLSSIENFGGMNILCSDKTGTITRGVVELKDAINLSGEQSPKVLQYAWLNASMQKGFSNPIDQAICRAYQSKETNNYELTGEIPYDFIRKRLTVAISDGTLSLMITKGAVKNVLEVCNRVAVADNRIVPIDAYQNQIDQCYRDLSNQGYRTLGLAYKEIENRSLLSKNQEENLVFLGFITLFDPPKENIGATIVKLGQMGVQLKIITGDNALIAQNLAEQLGIAHPRILTGQQMQQMSESALMRQAIRTHIFAEVEPNQKERIINVLKKAGNVVGFMGDGINDAPALHAADVGISVDSAVDVAKQAADIVLLNQDLDVLTDGIVAGRKTFTNTMKYIFMATSANFGNMFSMAGASLFLPFLPLLPKQILLTNLLTDFPEMAIATDRVDDKNIQAPQRWNMAFIRKFMIVFGLLSSVFDYLTFALLLLVLHAKEERFQTGWFIESVVSASLIVLVIRTPSSFIKSLPGKYLTIATACIVVFVLAIPYTFVGEWFGFVKMPPIFYVTILPLIVAYLLCGEFIKRWFYKKASKAMKI
ncbi:magnesium-translocating P-type ATPase [Mucilaginibacter sp. RS28]|uniref:Magnesium-transporting ATPase, P-type 1 n=1 Tax=Mucilaginibacter straminoryzae TaxID=2932774 RepID=A0A9X1X2S3_9SPHI|nr:magnesium-translocating P-type ATPase [Mucilaginibacter straminoryzae]MCJ8209571.1 magnesium-translocating P-type ATPase [Mucilaginibacter straminoryzae]